MLTRMLTWVLPWTLLLSGVLLLGLAPLAIAQTASTTVIQSENVRIEYARVLRAEPVYQTLRATSMVETCDQSSPVSPEADDKGGLSRVVGAVRDALTPSSETDSGNSKGEDCRMVPMEREFRRPIAYDVDYVHHGVKYRSRLPYDPGNRLRVRVSIMPVVTPAASR